MRAQITEIQVFKGVEGLLSHLQDRGCALAVVSSNARDNVRCVLGPRSCSAIGTFECGVSIFGKATRLERVLRWLGKDARDAIYIGDQLSDLQAARTAGMAFGAMSWGYGSLASFSVHRPDEMFDTPADITRISQ